VFEFIGALDPTAMLLLIQGIDPVCVLITANVICTDLGFMQGSVISNAACLIYFKFVVWRGNKKCASPLFFYHDINYKYILTL